MAFIYDLDNEGGGAIIGDSDTSQPALTIANFGTGGGLKLQSCASGAPLTVQSSTFATTFTVPTGGTVAALKVESYAAGYPAISINSTASGYPIDVLAINGTYGARFRSAVTGGNAVVIGRSTVGGSVSIAPLKFLGTSGASAALIEFAGGFISCTSINFVAGGMFADYALPVVVGGEQRYIPLVQAGAILEGAKF